MEDKYEIKKGDIVNIDMGELNYLDVEILSTPSQVGDYWIFKKGDRVYYLNELCTISKNVT